MEKIVSPVHWRRHPLRHTYVIFYCSVQFSHSVMSDSLWLHALQHARLPCPSQVLGIYSNSCTVSGRYCPSISSSVVPFSSCLQSFSAFNFSQHQGLFQWVISLHQVAKVSELQLEHQSLQWTPGLISFGMDRLDFLAVQGTLKSLLQHHSWKESILQYSAFFIGQLSHPDMTTGKTIALIR